MSYMSCFGQECLMHLQGSEVNHDIVAPCMRRCWEINRFETFTCTLSHGYKNGKNQIIWHLYFWSQKYSLVTISEDFKILMKP